MLRGFACAAIFVGSVLAQQTGATSATAAPGFQISGTVVDVVSNQPISGARVAISPVTQRDAFTTAVTGDDGRFLFPGLSIGKYTLTAQRRGYITQSFNQHGQYASSIAVGPDLGSTNLVFAIAPESAISGTVTDENGDAVRDAQVTLFQSSNGEGTVRTSRLSFAMNDDEGRYNFSHRQPGKYFIAVFATPWYAQRPQTRMKATNSDGSVSYFRGSTPVPDNLANAVIDEDPPSPLDVAYPLTFYGGATDAAGASPIMLGKGERISADITLQPVPAFHWRVSVADSDQTHGVFVSLEQKVFDGTPLSIPTSSSPIHDGLWEATGIPPGHYTASVYTGGNADQAEKQEVVVGESGVVEKAGVAALPLVAAVSLQPPAQLSGQASLQLRDIKTNQVFAEPVKGKGDIEFKPGIPRGRYEVSVFSTSDMFIQSVQATGARMTGRTLDVKGAAPVRLSVVLGQGRGEISGVALRNDKPVAGVMVLLVPADPENNRVLFRRDQSDSDGTFRISFAAPGRYTLLAIENGWDLEWANPAVIAKFMAQGEPLTVESKGKYSVKVKVQ